eukprot:TRINITY_DN315_c0_g3_i1.p1 TRINITY_DN315_c0_g3~~TRINITY_DN315_c0_g3_i1.p1  ORF type:complete len:2042 (+),score=867.65 TRINITY_DN315_c0_g3_i1:651-6128(+)
MVETLREANRIAGEEYEEKLNLTRIEMEESVRKLETENEEAKMECSRLADDLTKSQLHVPGDEQTSVSLKALYNRTTSAEERLAVTTAEKEKVEEYLETVISEVESRAPLLEQQRNAYHSALEMQETLNQRVEEACQQKMKLEAQLTVTANTLKDTEVDRDRFRQKASDLARQVQALLKRHIAMSGEQQQQQQLQLINQDNTNLDAQELISRNLVAFSDPVELQQRNEHLIEIVRKLTIDLEDKEKQLQEGGPQVVESLKRAEHQLKILRGARERQERMVQTIVDQRDTFKLMLSQSGNMAKSGFAATMPVSAQNNALMASMVDYKGMLEELKLEYETYKTDKNEHETLLTQNLDEMKNRCMELTNELHRVQANEKLATDRSSGFEKLIVSLRDDLERSQQFCSTLQIELSKQQQAVHDKSSEIMNLQSESRQIAQKMTILEREAGLMQSQLKSVENERQSLQEAHRQQLSLQQSVSSLEEMVQSKNNVETQKLSEANRQLGLDLESANARLREQQLLNERELTRFKEELESKNMEVRKLGDDLTQIKVDSAVLSSQLSSSKDNITEKNLRINHLEKRIESLTSNNGEPAAPIEEVEIFIELKAIKGELKTTQALLAEKTKQVEEFSMISGMNETNVSNLKAHAEKMESTLSGQIEELKDALSVKEDEFKKTFEALNIAEKTISDLNLTVSNLESRIESLNNEHNVVCEELKKTIAHKEESLEQLTKDIEVFRENLADMRQRYEVELENHAAAIKHNRDCDAKLENLSKQLGEAQAENTTLQSDMLRFQTDFSLERDSLMEQKTKAEEDCESQKKQNELLKTQVDELGIRVNEFRKTHMDNLSSTSEGVSTTTSTGTSSGANTQFAQQNKETELRELIRLLNRDMKIQSCELDVAKGDRNRLEQKVQLLQQHLQQSKSEVQELTRIAASPVNLEDHQKMQSLIEDNNLMRESAITLRQQIRLSENNEKAAREESIKAVEEMFSAQRSLSIATDKLKSFEVDLELANTDRNRWQKKAKSILERYQQIDPEEHAKMIVDFEASKKEIIELNEQATKTKLDSESRIKELEDKTQSITKELEEKIVGFQKEIFELKKEIAEVKTEKNLIMINKNELMKKFNKLTIAYTSSKETFKEANELKSRHEKEMAEMKESEAKMQMELKLSERKHQEALKKAELEAGNANNASSSVIPRSKYSQLVKKYNDLVKINKTLIGKKASASSTSNTATTSTTQATTKKVFSTSNKTAFGSAVTNTNTAPVASSTSVATSAPVASTITSSLTTTTKTTTTSTPSLSVPTKTKIVPKPSSVVTETSSTENEISETTNSEPTDETSIETENIPSSNNDENEEVEEAMEVDEEEEELEEEIPSIDTSDSTPAVTEGVQETSEETTDVTASQTIDDTENMDTDEIPSSMTEKSDSIEKETESTEILGENINEIGEEATEQQQEIDNDEQHEVVEEEDVTSSTSVTATGDETVTEMDVNITTTTNDNNDNNNDNEIIIDNQDKQDTSDDTKIDEPTVAKNTVETVEEEQEEEMIEEDTIDGGEEEMEETKTIEEPKPITESTTPTTATTTPTTPAANTAQTAQTSSKPTETVVPTPTPVATSVVKPTPKAPTIAITKPKPVITKSIVTKTSEPSVTVPKVSVAKSVLKPLRPVGTGTTVAASTGIRVPIVAKSDVPQPLKPAASIKTPPADKPDENALFKKLQQMKRNQKRAAPTTTGESEAPKKIAAVSSTDGSDKPTASGSPQKAVPSKLPKRVISGVRGRGGSRGRGRGGRGGAIRQAMSSIMQKPKPVSAKHKTPLTTTGAQKTIQRKINVPKVQGKQQQK